MDFTTKRYIVRRDDTHAIVEGSDSSGEAQERSEQLSKQAEDAGEKFRYEAVRNPVS